VAKKKTSKHKAQPVKEFSSSPFKNLKGLSAFAEQKEEVQKKPSREEKVVVKQAPDASDEQHSFADEMDFLGVKPLPESIVEESGRSVKKPAVEAPQVPKQSREEREETAFLEAIGNVEKVFKDEWPDEDKPAKQAIPRRMRQVERGQLKPEVELDLHGLSVDEASAKVRFFLQDAIYHGFQTALVITGKGLHSNAGPVLRQAMETLLSQQREQVIEWGVAPRRYGGDGALVVFLRQLSAE
jgi:DNA-nicking Smr family endonuclease